MTIIPEREWPTRTVGPSGRASTRSAEATVSGSVVGGFRTAVTLRPAACKLAITSDRHEPSANSPCTRTTLRAFGGAAAITPPRGEMNEAAAPATKAADKARRSMMLDLELSLSLKDMTRIGMI